MAITKARQQEILQYKIDRLTLTLSNFIKYGISIKKIDKLTMIKDSVVAAKAIVDAS